MDQYQICSKNICHNKPFAFAACGRIFLFSLRSLGGKQLYLKCILPYVVFCFSSIVKMFETFASELRGHLGVMGEAGACQQFVFLLYLLVLWCL